jgi:predicted RNase H-like nuclease
MEIHLYVLVIRINKILQALKKPWVVPDPPSDASDLPIDAKPMRQFSKYVAGEYPAKRLVRVA